MDWRAIEGWFGWREGQEEAVKSGFIILTPDCMLELRSQIDQMMNGLQDRGILTFSPDKLDG